MSLSVDMYMIVGREWLKNHYIKSFEQFPSCCGSFVVHVGVVFE